MIAVIFKAFIFITLSVLSFLPAEAAVFGDANRLNGVEDQRLARQDAREWPQEFKAVGRIYCADAVQGSAILSSRQTSEDTLLPILVTAKHVIEDFNLQDCKFAPEWDTWRRVDIVAVVAGAAHANSTSVPSKYMEDWIVVELSPWSNWHRYAIELKPNTISLETGKLRNTDYRAYMVGLDVLRNKMVVHADCSFGLASESRLLKGYNELYWDDCDSAQGGSGGALFVKSAGIQNKGAYEIVGLRVGSLFDELVVGKDPEMGSKFNIDAHINVTRAISSEILEPVCTFAKKGCEPVGNNDSFVEN